MEQLPFMAGQGEIHLGDNVTFSGRPVFSFTNAVNASPQLVIGDHTFIGHFVGISVGERVIIGRHCLLAGAVKISDYDGHPIDAARRRAGARPSQSDFEPVTIGDDVWIGDRAVILKGVTIGDRAIVGACAVVTRDVPAGVVVAGNPAQIVKQLESANQNVAQIEQPV